MTPKTPTEDRVFLENLADWFQDREHPESQFAEMTPVDIAAKLRAIAVDCDRLALELSRVASLENKVDAALCSDIETYLDDGEFSSGIESYLEGGGGFHGALVMALWLLCRRTKSAGNMHALGGGLGAIGTAALASMFKKEPP